MKILLLVLFLSYPLWKLNGRFHDRLVSLLPKDEVITSKTYPMI